MLQNNKENTIRRFISANATLSTISTTEFNATNGINTAQKLARYQTKKSSQKEKQIMKENNISPESNVSVEKIKRDKNKTEKTSQKTDSPKSPISKLSIVAITLTVCLGGFLYFHAHQQATNQNQVIEQLQSEITTLKESLEHSITDDMKSYVATAVNDQNKKFSALDQKVNSQLTDQTRSQQQFIVKVDDAIKVSEQNIVNFNERLSAMSTTDNNVWLISQANYLVNLAGRKIWNDQDYTTARLLLKNADAALAQANDPSLLPARQAINKDISALANISYTDFDGIVMKLLNLADSVTELPLVNHYQSIDLGMANYDDSIVESEENTNSKDSQENGFSNIESPLNDTEISSSISDWSDNLTKTSQSFFNQFIQIEKYDSFGECVANAGKNSELLKKCQVYTAVIMPEQSLYLRENIKLRLFIAAQAVPRHQELIYQQTLNDVATWTNAYFDTNDVSVKAFVNELTDLQHQSISNQNVPQQLASHEELEKLMQVRVRAMLAN